MKVFVSWSGASSKQAAELMRSWLPNVLQEADVWVSSQDIAKGERWASSIQGSLAEKMFGLSILTKDNLAAPWILFEAGALSKTLDSRFACVLCNVKHSDLAGNPLGQFQNAIVEKEDFFQVVASLNASAERPLEATRLTHIYEMWWPQFELSFKAISIETKGTAKKEATGEEALAERLTRIEGSIEGLVTMMSRSQSRPPNVNSASYVDPNLKIDPDVWKNIQADRNLLRTLDKIAYPDKAMVDLVKHLNASSPAKKNSDKS